MSIHDNPGLAREDSPLLEASLSSDGLAHQAALRPPYDLSSVLDAHRERRRSRTGGMIWVAEAAILIWFVSLITTVLTNQAGLFTFHPVLQSIGILLFYQGIIVLQPTETPAAKRTGLVLHECLQIVGSLAIICGASVIIYNKIIHSAPHFTSWHGLFGIISASLILLQAFFGALVGFEISRDWILGDVRARKMWKFHRAFGYLLIVLLTLTILTSTKSDWLVLVSKPWVLWILKISPVIGIVGLTSLTNFRKIFFR